MQTFLKLASVAVIGAALAGCGTGGGITSTQMQTANDGATAYASTVGGKYRSCDAQDGDNDGYVACSVDVPAMGTTPAVTKQVQCSYKQVGCKN